MHGNQFKENHMNKLFQNTVRKKSFSVLSKFASEPNRGLMHMVDLNMIFSLWFHYYTTSKEHT